MPELSSAARAVSITALTVGFVLAGTAVQTSAHAATRTVSFSFLYRLESKTWTQKPGNTTLAITNCDANTLGIPHATGQFHAELVRSLWGRDIRMEGHTLTCRKGQRVTFNAPVKGTYYFVFTKLDDNKLYKGTATISYPG